MPTANRLYANGNFVANTFDEVTLSVHRTELNSTYAKDLDELNISPITSGLARRMYANGMLSIAGEFDEVTSL
jgi:hypothetical protein